MTNSEPDLLIRFADSTDLLSIVEIYNQAIRSKRATADLDEYSLTNRVEWFESFDREKYPLYIIEYKGDVVGYCSLSPYRKGRRAMSTVAEVSYYLDYSYHGKNIGSSLLQYVISDCKRIGINTLLAILLDINNTSVGLLEKFNFEKWGYFPNIADIEGVKCGQFVYGLKVGE